MRGLQASLREASVAQERHCKSAAQGAAASGAGRRVRQHWSSVFFGSFPMQRF